MFGNRAVKVGNMLILFLNKSGMYIGLVGIVNSFFYFLVFLYYLKTILWNIH